MKFIIAFLFLAHGFAHLVGFVGLFRLGESVPYNPTLLGGKFELGDAGARVFGILWLLAALAFAAVALAVFMRVSWWPPLALAVALVSLAFCVLGWPDARIGAAIDAVVIVLCLVVMRTGWLALTGQP